MVLSRRTLLASAAATMPLLGAIGRAAAADPILVGVGGPLTGPNAEYGAEWKRGFDLALDAINGGGGIAGRPLAYDFQDTQSDPRQAVAVAQKFVGNPAIVAELGDLSSTASMAASPIYQRSGLVQFGFTNSHPDFTKGGDHMWSIATTQADDQPDMAQLAVTELAFKKLAVLHLATDWGRVSKDEPNVVTTEKGDPEWDAKVRDTILQLKQDGTLAAISRKWFGEDITANAR